MPPSADDILFEMTMCEYFTVLSHGVPPLVAIGVRMNDGKIFCCGTVCYPSFGNKIDRAEKRLEDEFRIAYGQVAGDLSYMRQKIETMIRIEDSQQTPGSPLIRIEQFGTTSSPS